MAQHHWIVALDKKKKREWITHIVLLPSDSLSTFRLVRLDGASLEFKLGDIKAENGLRVFPAQSQWDDYVGENFDQFLQETEKGGCVMGLMELLQPFSHNTGNPPFPNWLPLLIAITNQAKHVEERIPHWDDIRNAQHLDKLLFFQMEDSAFYYHSFAENAIASNYVDRLELSKKLVVELKKVKILSSQGYATEFLLDQSKSSLSELLEDELRVFTSKQFDGNVVIDRLWRHRNFALGKANQGLSERGFIFEDSFKPYVSPLLRPEHAREAASRELFEALSCQGGGRSSCQAHNQNIPICGNFVASNCKVNAGTLRKCWANYTKNGKSSGFASLGPVSNSVRTLREDFNEKKLLEFLKEQRPQRVSDDLLPIPRKVFVIPFLQTVLGEVSRIITELRNFSHSPIMADSEPPTPTFEDLIAILDL